MLDLPGLSALFARSRKLQHSQLLITVFDLPELNHKIFSYLSRKDLLRWTRVGKKWHHVIIPYIWDDLSTLTQSQYKRLAQMIIDDYERVQTGHQSSLAKYCPLIRKLGPVSGMLFRSDRFLFEFILDYVWIGEERLSATQLSTAQSVFRHFMLHCTHLDVLNFGLRHSRFHEPVKAIADSAIQHLRHLSIHGIIHQRVFKYMVTRIPVTLETLELSCELDISSDYQPAMEIDEAEQEPLSNLKHLTLRCSWDNFHGMYPHTLWRRSKSVETVDLITCWIGLYQLKANIMATFLETSFPNLNTINIEEIHPKFDVKDEGFARLLSTSRLGWRSVSIKGYVEFREQSWEALSRHTSTLESFTMVKRFYQDGVGMRPFFTSFPRLQSFVTLADGERTYSKINAIDAIDWIHQDSLTGSLTPWSCEYTLTDLRISICGIPRPDITHDRKGEKRHPVVEESYSGEGGMIQSRVYERLARFVNLEVLWLGSSSYYVEGPRIHSKKVMNHQYECLEMSLESGLDRLEGLKRLQVLNISLMATKVGQKEVQWMAEQWPRLREIHGLVNRGDALTARQWLKDNSPRIVASMKE